MAITVDHVPVTAAPRGWSWLDTIRRVGQAELLPGNAGQIARRVAWVVVVLAALAVVVFTAPILWGYRPTLGRSMEPTLPALGGFCKLEKLADPMGQLRPNDIVVVDGGTLGYSVKRVADVDPARGLYLLGDNADHSMDSSFGADGKSPWRETWVPFDEVRGRVTDIWSPERALRSRDKWTGDFRNLIEFAFPPAQIRYISGHRAVVDIDDSVIVYAAPGWAAWKSAPGTTFGGVDGQTLAVNRRGRPEVTRVDLGTFEVVSTAAPAAGQRVRLTPSRSGLVRTYFAPVCLPARFKTTVDGVERSCSAIPSPDPLGSIVVIVPAPPTDGAIEVEVIEAPDEGTEIAATSPN